MTDLILHHYEGSPFAEKVRLALGYKQLAYRAVRIPAVMPKPDVIALTGGYRKTPLLQIGNHVYCDTSLIVRVLERRVPSPPLLTGPLAELVANWADAFLFDNAVSLVLRPTRVDALLEMMRPEELAVFADDRKAMATGARRLPPAYATARAQLPIFASWLEGLLREQEFLLGSAPSIADLAAYHPLWLVDLSAPELLEPFVTLRAWMKRVAAIGHGMSEGMSSGEALEVCRLAAPASAPLPAHSAPELSPGQMVRVRASDVGREPTEGKVVFATEDEFAIARTDERAGDVVVHFPRLGYDVIPV